MSMEARMSLSNVSQEYSFFECAVLGKRPSTAEYRICGSENYDEYKYTLDHKFVY